MFLFLSCSDSDPVIYVPPILGCMDQSACNYNSDAEQSCTSESEDCELCNYEVCVGCTHGPGFDSIGNEDVDNPGACNYDSNATEDTEEGSCEYDSCAGCTDETACNFDADAIIDNLSDCDFESCSGCTDETACNYDADATIDSGNCYSTYSDLAQSIDVGGSAFDDADVCLMPENSIYITSSGTVLYNVSEDIYGFQFNVSGTTVSSVSGGDAVDSGLTVQLGQSGLIIGYSITGDFIPMGCGTLTNLALDGSINQVSNIIVSNVSGEQVSTLYLTGCDCNLASTLDCSFECGGSDFSCIDCAGISNGSSAVDCAGVCGGSAIDNCSASMGECVVSQEACNDLIALQAFIDANQSLAAENPSPQSLFDNNLAGRNSEDGRVSWIQIIDKGIATIPSSIQSLTELKVLNLSSNSLNNLSSNITSLNNLTSLNVSFNNIASIPNIENLTLLIDLNIDGNIITSLPSLSGLGSLVTLDVGSNGLLDLPNLPSSLQTIYADQNSLSFLPSAISNLNYVDVRFNQLTSLPSGVCSSNSITALHITGNKICPETDFESGGQYYSCINLGAGLVGNDSQICGD